MRSFLRNKVAMSTAFCLAATMGSIESLDKPAPEIPEKENPVVSIYFSENAQDFITRNFIDFKAQNFSVVNQTIDSVQIFIAGAVLGETAHDALAVVSYRAVDENKDDVIQINEITCLALAVTNQNEGTCEFVAADRNKDGTWFIRREYSAGEMIQATAQENPVPESEMPCVMRSYMPNMTPHPKKQPQKQQPRMA